MKILAQTSIVAIFVLLISTLLTMKFEASADGLDELGFPFIFYNHFEGKCADCYHNYGFKPFGFLANVMVALCVGLIIVFLWNKFRRQSHN